MSTLRADGQAIERRIEAMKLEDASVSYGEISARTADLGPGYAEVLERTLKRARDGEKVQAAALKSIAKVLGLELREIVVSEDQAQVSEHSGSHKTMTAISASHAPAVNAEQNAHVSININTPRRSDEDG